MLRDDARAPAGRRGSRRPLRRWTRCCPATAPLADRLAAEDDALDRPARPGPAVVDALVAAVPRRGPRGCSACRRRGPPGRLVARTSRGPATTGTTAAYARGWTSTSTCRSGCPGSSASLAHETYPGHHLEHALKERMLVEELGRLEASVLLINTPECLISEGLATSAGARRAARRAGRTCSWSWRRSPGCRSPPTRGPARRRGPPGGDRRAARRSSTRRASTPRCCSTRTAGRATRCSTTSSRSGAFAPDDRGEAARVHRAPAVAALRVRLRRGRGAAPATGWTSSRPERAGPLRPAAAGAAHARRRSRRRSTRLRSRAGRRRRRDPVREVDRLPSAGTR